MHAFGGTRALNEMNEDPHFHGTFPFRKVESSDIVRYNVNGGGK
jgi:hypothetical protein